MSDVASTTAAQPRAGSRYGASALVLAFVVVLWPTLTAIGVVFSLSETMPDVLRILTLVMFFIGWAVVPLSLVLSVVFGILAIRRNRRLGKICGVIALVIVALVVVAFIVLGAFGFLGSGFMGSGLGL